MLQGKRALVVGVANARSIAWGIADRWRSEGAEVFVTYQVHCALRVMQVDNRSAVGARPAFSVAVVPVFREKPAQAWIPHVSVQLLLLLLQTPVRVDYIDVDRLVDCCCWTPLLHCLQQCRPLHAARTDDSIYGHRASDSADQWRSWSGTGGGRLTPPRYRRLLAT